jgi:hypothetical protein
MLKVKSLMVLLGSRKRVACPECGPLVVDHDHDHGKVRGLLCEPCNQGIGRLKDDPDLIRSAITYLQRSRSQVNA